MKTTLLFTFIAGVLSLYGQDDASFKLYVSDDTILIGNYFEIKYEATNLQGEFDIPEFEDFAIVSGPNQSRNMSFTNGQSQSSSSISFLLKPKSVDVLSLPPAYFVTPDQTFEAGPRDISVLPNPDGVVTESRLDRGKDEFNFFHRWGDHPKTTKKRKKKLKETKI